MKNISIIYEGHHVITHEQYIQITNKMVKKLEFDIEGVYQNNSMTIMHCSMKGTYNLPIKT